MKKLMAVIMLFSSMVFAVGPTPKELQGGTITVTLKDGKTYTFSSDEYAVVKRGTEEKPVAAVTKEKSCNDCSCSGGCVSEAKRLRVTLSAGSGFTNQDVDTQGNYTTVDQKREAVGAVGLSYKILPEYDISIGGTAISNKTYLFDLSKDF